MEYDKFRVVSKVAMLWDWNRVKLRLAGDNRWWCKQLLRSKSASLSKSATGRLPYVFVPSSASCLFLFPRPAACAESAMADQRVVSVVSPRSWAEVPPKRSGVMYITRPSVVGGRGAEGAVCSDAVTNEGAVMGEGNGCKQRRWLSQTLQRQQQQQRNATSVGSRPQERATRVGGTKDRSNEVLLPGCVDKHAILARACAWRHQGSRRQSWSALECHRPWRTAPTTPGPPQHASRAR
jgi:hypothetical protein